MFLFQLFIGILAYFLFEAQKHLTPKAFSFKLFWTSNKWYMLWCVIMSFLFFACNYFAPESLSQLLSEFGYKTSGELSGVTSGVAIAVLSKRFGKTTKKDLK